MRASIEIRAVSGPNQRLTTFCRRVLSACSQASCLAPATLFTVMLIAGTPIQAQPFAPKPTPVQVYDFEVLARVSQARDHFVQGLQIVGNTLYVGTGQYGESRLLEYEFPSMQLRRQLTLSEDLFGEGVTRFGDKLFQLTWQAGKIFEYDANTFELTRTHTISTEGWGITANAQELIYSDGSAQLYFLDPVTLQTRRTLAVTLNGNPLPRLNELEWIRGTIWANVFGANQLVSIDPKRGAVTAIIDLRGLLDKADYQEGTDVLNGIAWDEGQNALWVTGKRWPWIFRVKLRLRPPASAVGQ